MFPVFGDRIDFANCTCLRQRQESIFDNTEWLFEEVSDFVALWYRSPATDDGTSISIDDAILS